LIFIVKVPEQNDVDLAILVNYRARGVDYQDRHVIKVPVIASTNAFTLVSANPGSPMTTNSAVVKK
jgi:hypothetical protein